MDLERGRQLRRQQGSPYKRALVLGSKLVGNSFKYAAPVIANAFGSKRLRSDSAMPRSRSRGRTMRRSPSRLRSKSRSRYISGGVTTEQRDFATRYVNRRMPSGRRRRWRSFTRKVQHVMLQMGGTQSFNALFQGRNTGAVNTCRWDGQMIGGTTATNNDELFQAFRRAYGAALTTTTVDDYKLFIKSLCLDIQISNVGDKNVILEMHTLVLRKNYNVASRVDVMYSDTLAEVPPQAGFTQATNTDVTSTLFQNSLFCQYWRILKKTQIVISPGETTTLQLRIPYNRMLQGKLIETNPVGIPGFTRAMFWQAKGSPEYNAPNVQHSDFEIVWQCQTFINYQIPPSSSRTATSLP